MENNVLMAIADGFEEIEAITCIDVLRRAKINVDIASIEQSYVVGAHGLTIKADKLFSDCNLDNYACIVMPGGYGCAESLGKSSPIFNAIKKYCKENKIVAAICASPALVLAKNNFLENIKATCYPSMKSNLSNFIDQKVVHDKNFITSQGPATALDFALYLVKIITNEQTKNDIKENLLA